MVTIRCFTEDFYMPTIVELANQAGQLTRAMSARADLNLHSPMFLGLASGFDVAILSWKSPQEQDSVALILSLP